MSFVNCTLFFSISSMIICKSAKANLEKTRKFVVRKASITMDVVCSSCSGCRKIFVSGTFFFSISSIIIWKIRIRQQ